MSNTVIIEKLALELGVDLQTLRTNLTAARKNVSNETTNMEREFTRLNDSIGKIRNTLLTVFATGFGAKVVKDMAMVAARTETLDVVLKVVGKSAGYTAQQMEGYVDSIKRLGITTQDTRLSLLRFLQAGLDLDKAAPLARVAQNAATIANTSSSEAFTGLVHGIVTLQQEVLRTYGVIISNEQAVLAWAKANGKTVDSISQTQKQQISLNTVIEAGTKIQGAYVAAMNTAGKQYTSLSRYIQEFQLILGQEFLPLFSEVVNFIKEMTTDSERVENLRVALAGIAQALNTIFQVLKFIITKLSDFPRLSLSVLTFFGVLAGSVAIIKTLIMLFSVLKVAILGTTAATEGATLATTLFNRVLAMNPIMRILTLISLAIAAFTAFRVATVDTNDVLSASIRTTNGLIEEQISRLEMLDKRTEAQERRLGSLKRMVEDARRMQSAVELHSIVQERKDLERELDKRSATANKLGTGHINLNHNTAWWEKSKVNESGYLKDAKTDSGLTTLTFKLIETQDALRKMEMENVNMSLAEGKKKDNKIAYSMLEAEANSLAKAIELGSKLKELRDKEKDLQLFLAGEKTEEIIPDATANVGLEQTSMSYEERLRKLREELEIRKKNYDVQIAYWNAQLKSMPQRDERDINAKLGVNQKIFDLENEKTEFLIESKEYELEILAEKDSKGVRNYINFMKERQKLLNAGNEESQIKARDYQEKALELEKEYNRKIIEEDINEVREKAKTDDTSYNLLIGLLRARGNALRESFDNDDKKLGQQMLEEAEKLTKDKLRNEKEYLRLKADLTYQGLLEYRDFLEKELASTQQNTMLQKIEYQKLLDEKKRLNEEIRERSPKTGYESQAYQTKLAGKDLGGKRSVPLEEQIRTLQEYREELDRREFETADEKAAKILEVDNELSDKRREKWEEDYFIFSDFLGAMESAYDAYVNSLFDKDVTNAEREKALKEAATKYFVGNLTKRFTAYVKSKIMETTLTEATESKKTAVTAVESSKRIVLEGKETGAKLMSAVADGFKWLVKLLGPFAIPAGLVFAGGLFAAFKGLRNSVPGFEEGGLVKKGQVGFFEGNGVEIVAPEKDFKEVFAKYSHELLSTIVPEMTRDGAQNNALHLTVDLSGSFVTTNDESTVDKFYRGVIVPAVSRHNELMGRKT